MLSLPLRLIQKNISLANCVKDGLSVSPSEDQDIPHPGCPFGVDHFEKEKFTELIP